jgi:hypothetical protein
MYHPASHGQRNVRLIVQHQQHYLIIVVFIINGNIVDTKVKKSVVNSRNNAQYLHLETHLVKVD